MSRLLIRKEVAVLPASLTPDTIYLVRRGLGFDFWITDNAGLLVFQLNNTQDPLASPQFTYVAGVLTRIDYSDGSYKVFTYVAGVLTRIDLVRGTRTYRKDFNYSAGNLTSIVETLL